MINNNRIRWINKSIVGTGQCPLCESSDLSHKLDVADDALNIHRVQECRRCETVFYPHVLTNGKVEYYGEDLEHKNWRNFYVEVGAGIQFILEIIDRVPIERFNSFIDIGCGTGFSVDYVKNFLGKMAVGAEPSIYGRDGEAGFGTTIFDKPLQELAHLKNEKFDFIFSSEVIEHVRDPRGFLQAISGYLSADGILALTTPNARFIQRKSMQSRVYAALFPGEHKIIFSKQSLSSCLRGGGFEHIEMGFSSGQTLVVYASKSPLKLNRASSADAYLRYLSRRLDISPLGESMAKAYRGRLFLRAVDTGAMDEANRLAPVIYRDINIDRDDIPSECSVFPQITSFKQYGDHFSYAHGAILYALSVFENAANTDRRAAYKLSKLAVDAITKELTLGREHMPLADSLLARSMILNAQLDGHLNEGDWVAALIERMYLRQADLPFSTIKKLLKGIGKENKLSFRLFGSRRKLFLVKLMLKKILGANN